MILRIVIPCFNNAETLEATVKEIDTLFENDSTVTLQVLLVDDGSQDSTWDVIVNISLKYHYVNGIKLTRNFGQINAIICGLAQGKFDCAVVVSADLQDPISLISEMCKYYNDGHKIIIAARKSRNDGLLKNITSTIFHKIIQRKVNNYPEGGFDYFLIDKEVADYLISSMQPSQFLQGAILSFGLDPIFIPYERVARKFGKSGWTLKKRINYSVDILTQVTYAPLRVASFLGISFTVFGFLWALYVFFLRIKNETPFDGFASIIIILLVSSGLILSSLSWLGEYIIRISLNISRNPTYIVEKIVKK